MKTLMSLQRDASATVSICGFNCGRIFGLGTIFSSAIQTASNMRLKIVPSKIETMIEKDLSRLLNLNKLNVVRKLMGTNVKLAMKHREYKTY